MYDREPLYVISVAARLLDMHAQTLRKYEREQFIKPSRTQGRLRLYSAEDIERLRQIKYLVEERGLNLDGVQPGARPDPTARRFAPGRPGAKTREDAVALVEAEMQKLLQVLGAPQAREQRQPPLARWARAYSRRLRPPASEICPLIVALSLRRGRLRCTQDSPSLLTDD